ncbi:MAG: hypothetical protein WBW99_17030 [Pseudolabrys sp.]
MEAQWPHKTGRNVHTLFLVTIYVEAILSLLLLFVWAQNMALRAVCWWGFAYLIQLGLDLAIRKVRGGSRSGQH